MIIFGYRSTLIANEQIPDACEHCGTINSLKVVVFQKYAHVFWIPCFPIGRVGATQCSHCQEVVESDKINGPLYKTYEDIKTKAKTPIWAFTGLALIAILIIAGLISNKVNDAKNAELIAAPKKGDIYEVKVMYNVYTLYAVVDVVGDSVFMIPNEYQTNKSSGLKQIKNKGFTAFVFDTLGVTKEEIRGMYKKNMIIGVDR